MAVTQYIGARYVPIFYTDQYGGNDWEAGVQYEPLTIVTYLNQSYTSKKQVPAYVTNPADEPDYWVITGGYNSQVAQLAQDVQDLTDLVEDWRATKIISIGASINLDTGGNLTGGFPDLAFNALGMTSGVDYYNSAVGGSGFTTGSQTFEDQLDTAIATLDDTFKNARGRIIVTGGMNNDINNGATYLAAVDSFVAKARANFPKFTIEFLPLSWSIQHTTRVSLRTLYETYLKQLPDHGVILWSEFYAYMHNYVDWFRDNIHFSATGITVMARNFMKVITGSSRDFNPNEGYINPGTPTNINTTDFSSLGPFNNIKEYYDGNMIWVAGGDGFFDPVSPLTMSYMAINPTIACDNPFHYISTTPFAAGTQYGEIPCGFRNAAGTEIMDGFMFINANGKLAFYARQNNFVLTSGTNLLKFFSVGIPKEYC